MIMDRLHNPDLSVSANHRPGWSIPLDIPPESIDRLGHMSASLYPLFVDPALAEFFRHIFGGVEPDCVAAEYRFSFRRELVALHGPVRVYATVESISTSAIEVALIIDDNEGTTCTKVNYRAVLWDPARRRSRPMTAAERSRIEPHIGR